ncbi:MAG: hypothetical protein V4642_14790 [Bacteroidota bacterium]
MKIFFIVCLIIATGGNVSAQKQANEWIFGDRCHISFATGVPVVRPPVPLTTDEGSASQCDKNGKLLFYTNGETVWNRDHRVMPNGTSIAGGISSAQSALIVPHPEDENLYFLFTAADLTNKNGRRPGFHYTIVDMTLDNGSGGIKKKNVELFDDSTSEAVSATPDCKGEGYWIVTHNEKENIFYTFHLTKTGVDAVPVISRIPQSKKEEFKISQIKISPDGSLLALTDASGAPLLSLYAFDNSTGRVSNPRVLMDGSTEGCYGASFSPDNTKLYVTQSEYTFNSYRDSSIAQFTVNLATEAEIKQSKINIKKYGEFPALGVLQLAPDGKIYVNQGSYLGVIEKPNERGTACLYRDKAIYLNGLEALNGLPNFIDSYFRSSPQFTFCALPESGFESKPVCEGRLLVYKNTSKSTAAWHWQFEGGKPLTWEGENPPPILYEKAGSFTTRLITENNIGLDTVFATIIVSPYPKIEAGKDTSICVGFSIPIGGAPEAGTLYRWTPLEGLSDPSSSNPIASPMVSTKYILEATGAGNCKSYDEVFIAVNDLSTFRLTPDTAICRGGSVRLQAQAIGQGLIYTWRSTDAGLNSYTSDSPLATPESTTQYYVSVMSPDGNCKAEGYVTITVYLQPKIEAGKDTTVCIGSSVPIGCASETGVIYRWTPVEGLSDPASANPIASPITSTRYILEATGANNCKSYDEIFIKVNDLTSFRLTPDTQICRGESVRLLVKADGEGLIYKWRDTDAGLDSYNSDSPVATPDTTTQYYVSVTLPDGNCRAEGYVTIKVFPLPKITLRDTTLCTGDQAQLFLKLENGSENGVMSYAWEPPDGLDRTDIARPIVTGDGKTRVYTVTATNEHGCTVKRNLTVHSGVTEEITVEIASASARPEPGSRPTVRMHIFSGGSIQKGITSFVAHMKFDPAVFQFEKGSITSITGFDKSWAFNAIENPRGEITIQGQGNTPVFDGSVALYFNTFLGRQTDSTLYFTIDTIDGESTFKNNLCRSFRLIGNELKLIAGDVCGGSMRFVNLLPFENALNAATPNPIQNESELEYSVAMDGEVALQLYNPAGELMKTLVSGYHKAGKYKAKILARDLPNGVYMCEFKTQQRSIIRQCIVIH